MNTGRPTEPHVPLRPRTTIITPGEPEPEPEQPKQIGIVQVALALATAAAVLMLLIALAPKPIHKSVNPSVITPGAASGSVCGNFGTVVSAVLTSDAGPYRLYHVTCSDGVNFDVAR